MSVPNDFMQSLQNIKNSVGSTNTAFQFDPSMLQSSVAPWTPPSQTSSSNTYLPAVAAAGATNNAQAVPGTAAADVPLWKKLLAIANVPHAAVANLINDAVTGQGIGQGWNNVFTLNPQNQVGTDQILNNLGWKANANSPWWDKAAHGVTDFLGDTLTDPLTYLTFGGSTVAKLGENAALDAAKNVAKDAGIQGAKSVNDVVQGVHDTTYNSLVQSGMDPNLAKVQAEQAASNATSKIQNASNLAQNTNKNTLASFGIPFTNKVAPILSSDKGFSPMFGIGTALNQVGKAPILGDLLKGTGRVLQKTEQPIGTVGSGGVRDALEKIGYTTNEAQDKFANQAFGNFGVQTVEQMTPSMRQAFFSKIGEIPTDTPTVTRDLSQGAENINDWAGLNGGYKEAVPTVDTQGLVNSLDPKVQGIVEPMLQGMGNDLNRIQTVGSDATRAYGDLAGTAPLLGKTAKGSKVLNNIQDTFHNAADQLKDAKPIETGWTQQHALVPVGAVHDNPTLLSKLQDFQPGAEGQSALGRKLSSLGNLFNPRANDVGHALEDAAAYKLGHATETQREIANLQKMLKGLTPAEQSHLAHFIENDFPKSSINDPRKFLSPDKIDQLQKVVPHWNSLMQKLAKEQIANGTLDTEKVIPNYFKHIYNKDESNALTSKYLNRTAVNKSNIERTGFKSLAEWKDTLHSMQQAQVQMRQAGEDTTQISQDIERMKNLMESDPTKVLHDTMSNAFDKVANKQMHNSLIQSGLVRVNPIMDAEAGKDFVHVKPELANKLDLPPGAVVHKSVEEGMHKFQGLFKEEKFNKLLQIADSLTNIWKPLLIAYRPSHFFTRFMGNLGNATLAGAHLGNFKAATSLIAKGGDDSPLWKAALDKGIVKAHTYSDQMGLSHYSDNTLGAISKKVNENALTNKVYGGLNWMDNVSRLAVFMKGMKEYGGNAEKAATLTRKYLFNYSELTNADRLARTVVPFWSWARHNLPLQVSELAKQPRYYQAVNRIQQNLQGQSNNLVPSWGQDMWKIPGVGFLNMKGPWQDLTKYDPMTAIQQGFQPELADLNPGIQIPFEMAANKNFFTNQPIDKYKTQNQGYSAGDYAKTIGGEFGPAQYLNGVVKKGQTPIQDLVTAIAGHPQQFDPATEARYNKIELQKEKSLQNKKAKALAKQGG